MAMKWVQLSSGANFLVEKGQVEKSSQPSQEYAEICRDA